MSRFTKCNLLLLGLFYSAVAHANLDSYHLRNDVKKKDYHEKAFNLKDGDSNLYHQVRAGETLSDIALNLMKKHGISVSSIQILKIAHKIALYNNIENPDLIIPGQKIQLSKILDLDLTSSDVNIDFFNKKKLQSSDEKRRQNFEPEQEYLSKRQYYFQNFNLPRNLKLNFTSSSDVTYKTEKLKTIFDDFIWLKRLNKVNNLESRKLIVSDYLSKLDSTFIKDNRKIDEGSQNFHYPKNESLVLIDSIDKETQNAKSDFSKLSENIKIFYDQNNKQVFAKEKNYSEQILKFKEDLESNSNLSFDEEENKFSKKINTLKIVEKKELESLVQGIVDKADKPEMLPKFKNFQQIIAQPFGSTPLFLQTLESLKIAEERKKEAFSKFLPKASSSIGGGLKSGGINNDSSSQSMNLTISQLVYDFGVTSRKYQVTEKEELSSRYKIDQQRTELLLDLISAFFEVYRAETLLKLSQGFIDTRRDFLESVKTREKLGGSSNADVIRAETKLSEALDRVPTEVQNLKNSKAVFLEYFDTFPNVKTEMHQLPGLQDAIFELNNENIDKNFRVAELTNQIKAAELNSEAEKRSRFGRFGLQAGYQNTDTNLLSPQEQSSILLTYQIDLFSGYERTAKISQAALKVNALKFELDRLRKELVRELSQAENSFEAQSALVLSRIALVKGAALSNQVNRELFELNKASINDLFRSQEEFLTAAKNLVDATVEKNLSYYKLAAKFGTLLNLFELRT